jgi:hypothetical protein
VAIACGIVLVLGLGLLVAAGMALRGNWRRGSAAMKEWERAAYDMSASEALRDWESIRGLFGVAYYALSQEQRATPCRILWGKFFAEGDYDHACRILEDLERLGGDPDVAAYAYVAALAHRPDVPRRLLTQADSPLTSQERCLLQACEALAQGEGDRVPALTEGESPAEAGPSGRWLWIRFVRAEALVLQGESGQAYAILGLEVCPNVRTMTEDFRIAAHVYLCAAKLGEEVGDYRGAWVTARCAEVLMTAFRDASWNSRRESLRQMMLRLEDRVRDLEPGAGQAM